MKLPLRVEYGEGTDADRVYGIVDADGKTVVETDCGVYPPKKKEDAEFIVAACNNAMTETRAREILDQSGWGDGNRLNAHLDTKGNYVNLGEFCSADELEAIAWWMRNKSAPQL